MVETAPRDSWSSGERGGAGGKLGPHQQRGSHLLYWNVGGGGWSDTGRVARLGGIPREGCDGRQAREFQVKRRKRAARQVRRKVREDSREVRSSHLHG